MSFSCGFFAVARGCQAYRVYSALSPDQSVLNFCSTAARLQRRRRYRPAYAAPASLVRYTNRPFSHSRVHTKRLS